MISSFIRFFDKTGSDLNLASVDNSVISLYNGSKTTYESFSGKLFFPQVSSGLVESQNLYLLQEVTGPVSKFELRRVSGSFTIIGGNPTITAINSDFTLLTAGDTIKIGSDDYTILSIASETSMQISPTPSASLSTTDVYYYDYLSYSELRSEPGTSSSKVIASIPVKSTTTTATFNENPFFIYDVNYSEDNPFIEKGILANYDLANGSSDTIDPLTGRIQLSSINTIPLQVNIGIQSEHEYVYEDILEITLEKDYILPLSQAPDFSGEYGYFYVSGTSNLFYDISEFHLSGPGVNTLIKVLGVGITGADTFLKIQKIDNPVTSTNFASYSINLTNKFKLADLDLYGEVEGEDERFRQVLQNFGKRIDFDNEYIFRDSDIKEELPDYRLLNKKRKELLLEGDNIYPYLGSYRALINIINFFGYYDVRIKEYFLNVDQASSNFGDYMHVLVPKNAKQRDEVKEAWKIVPSKIYKKTALFGLFYDLNKTTDNEDIYGIPEVVDAFDYSPEEVLIKLFGLKELLKKEYLPLNARIYDITGEGIYFERIRIDSWADNLHHLVLDIGKHPVFSITPSEPYVSDIRRLDNFYIEKFIEQGLQGFAGATATNPAVTAIGYTGPVSSLYSTYLDTYDNYQDIIYDQNGNLLPPVDSSWQYMPPGIYNPDYNLIMSRNLPLADEKDITAGAPILLESFFDITWEESYFNWAQLSIAGPTGSPINVNIWTWESVGKGEYIDMRWTVQKSGENGFFYDSERRPIESFVEATRGATAFYIEGKATLDMVNGSIANVNILQGYGYTASPAIFIPGPGIYTSLNSYSTGTSVTTLNTIGLGVGMVINVVGGTGGFVPGTTVTSVDSPNSFTVSTSPLAPLINANIQGIGTTASVTLTVNEGYIAGATWSAGSGYSFTPTVTVAPPPTVYEVQNRILHAVALPYEGEYDIALYNYDITNNYTVDFKKCYVKNKKADFISVSKKETPERRWEEFKHISWKDVTGPWYYPIHVVSSWQDANISWESLDFVSFKDQSLYEYPLDNNLYSIDRDTNLIAIDGNLAGKLSDAFTLNVGDSIFFARDESDPIVRNLKILPNQIDSRLLGFIGLTSSNALLSGVIGSTSISTSPYNTSSFITGGDNLWIANNWYKVDSVGATSISVTTDLLSTFTSQQALHFNANNEIVMGYTGSFNEMKRFSRIVLSDSCDYTSINPSLNYYDYVDGLTASSSTITIKEDEQIIKKIVLANSSLSGNKTLYASWGILSGTYALEIKNINYSGGKTYFRVYDPNKELYYLDGNFKLNLADYDVDYAETRIGAESLTYQYSDELTWDENPTITWGGLGYQGGVLCGFTIPFVAPGGSITVDEEASFFLSGNVNINSTKAGLEIAAQELNNSLNPGIIKYTYDVLPDDERYLVDSSGANLITTTSLVIGATSIDVNGILYNFQVPAEITVGVTSGSISSVTIVNPGAGYTAPPNVIVDTPCGGLAAIITLIITDGQVTGYSFTGGSGYTSVPTVTVEPPIGYEPFDNYVWTGSEWVEVIDTVQNLSTTTLNLGSPLVNPSAFAVYLLMPYDYHKQLYLNRSLFQQYYFFIHAEAKNSSDEMLSYINFANGVESEWLIYPDRSYTYPLRNSLLFSSVPAYNNLTQDILYNKWIYEGSDYPPLNIYPDYASDKLSFSSRAPYSGIFQSPFSFIDTVVSDKQSHILQYTPVIFNYDNCTIPGKNSPVWVIKEDGGNIQAISNNEKFMWNFTRSGNFTVSLSIKDSNGNQSVANKTSFIVVNEFKELNPVV